MPDTTSIVTGKFLVLTKMYNYTTTTPPPHTHTSIKQSSQFISIRTFTKLVLSAWWQRAVQEKQTRLETHQLYLLSYLVLFVFIQVERLLLKPQEALQLSMFS